MTCQFSSAEEGLIALLLMRNEGIQKQQNRVKEKNHNYDNSVKQKKPNKRMNKKTLLFKVMQSRKSLFQNFTSCNEPNNLRNCK